MPRRNSFASRVKARRGSLGAQQPTASRQQTRPGGRRPSPSTAAPHPPSSILHPPSSTAKQAPSDLPPPTSHRPQPEPDPGYVAVGRVLGPFGLKGELRVQPLTDNPARFEPKARLWAGGQKVTVLRSREAGGHLYVTFKGHPDRTAAERFRQALLQIPETDLPPLPDGEYYRFQLLGLTVVDSAGATLGTLDEIIETGANDVYRVRTAAGADILLAATPDVVLSIDLEVRRMVVDPPDWT